MREISVGEGTVTSLTLAPDRRSLAVVLDKHLMRWWHLDEPMRQLAESRVEDPPADCVVAFSHGGHVLATAGGPGLIVRPGPESPPLLLRTDVRFHARGLAFTPDSRSIVAVGRDVGVSRGWMGVHVELASRKQQVFRDPWSKLSFGLNVGPDARFFTSQTGDNVVVWDSIGCHPIARWPVASARVRASASETRDRLALLVADRLDLADLPEGARGGQLTTLWRKIVGPGLDPGGSLPLLSHVTSLTCDAAQLEADPILTADGSALLVAGPGPVVRLYDIASNAQRGVWTLPVKRVLCLATTQDGGTVGAGSDDGRAFVWDIAPRPPVEPADSAV